VALLQELPDGVVVLVRHRVVGVVPVHPVAEPDGLLGLDGGELADALLALLHEAGQAELLDVTLALEAEFLLHLHFHPEPLAVEAVLVAQLASLHGVEALVAVLVGAAPGMVELHRVIRRDGAVQERPARTVPVLLAQGFEGALLLPQLEHPVLQLDEGDARGHFAEHGLPSSRGKGKSG
jgi:hypothetical protein